MQTSTTQRLILPATSQHVQLNVAMAGTGLFQTVPSTVGATVAYISGTVNHPNLFVPTHTIAQVWSCYFYVSHFPCCSYFNYVLILLGGVNMHLQDKNWLEKNWFPLHLHPCQFSYYEYTDQTLLVNMRRQDRGLASHPRMLRLRKWSNWCLLPIDASELDVRDSISIYSSIRRTLTIRPQQDFSKSSCSCCCPPLLLCSFLVPLDLPSHYPSISWVVYPYFLFPPLVRIALQPVAYFPSSSLCARTMSAFFSWFRLSM